MITLLGTVHVPKSLVILAAASNAAVEVGVLRVTVTSGNDSTHMVKSKHFTDEALDFRTRDLAESQASAWRLAVLRHLGAGYQAVLEPDHLHVEYDPHA